MAEVKVEKQTPLARREATGLSPVNDFFAAGFPMERFFGMSPFSMSAFKMMREFSQEMDRVFGTGTAAGTWSPAVDIQRCNGNMVVTADLPGMNKNEVKVEVTDEGLVIEGERNREHTEDHAGYHRYERNYGKFYRSIPLPEGALPDQARAEMTNGILKITVPAPEKKQTTRQIVVNEAQGAPAAPEPAAKPVAA